MRTRSRWLLTVVAAACNGCLPTITIKKDAGGGCVNATVKEQFTVPLDVPVALWKIDNKCGQEVAVEVKNFTYGGVSRDPMNCLGHPKKTGTTESGWFACVIKYDQRENNPYKYEVWVDGKRALDPQIVIKKDRDK